MPELITDSYFQQGVTHEICEDYALHGPNYVVLSDGCSNGGGPSIESDWGSRLLAKAGEQYIRLVGSCNQSTYGEACASLAKDQCAMFPNLSINCLTATLAATQFDDKTKTFYNILFGDGMILGRRRDKSWEIHQYEFIPGGTSGQSAPFYPKYILSKGDVDRYFELFGGNYLHTIYKGDLFSGNSEDITKEEISGTLDKDKLYFDNQFSAVDFDLNLISTDGIFSFYQQVRTETSKYNTPVNLLDVLRIAIDVHTRPGFLRLQRHWAFKRDVAGTFVRRKWQNSDDVSFGGIYCPPI
jgi:hypothetical protein